MSTDTTTGTTNTLPAPAAQPDDLGIDRAFLMQMARVPFIAVGWVLVAFLCHHVWNAVAPDSTNYAPLVVVCFGMVLAAVIDGWAFKVPNWLTLSLVVSGWGLGAFHSLGVAVDAGTGGLGAALLCTAIGFGLLFPLLAIVGMGQGDVKMLMGFGSWIGALLRRQGGGADPDLGVLPRRGRRRPVRHRDDGRAAEVQKEPEQLPRNRRRPEGAGDSRPERRGGSVVARGVRGGIGCRTASRCASGSWGTWPTGTWMGRCPCRADAVPAGIPGRVDSVQRANSLPWVVPLGVEKLKSPSPDGRKKRRVR